MKEFGLNLYSLRTLIQTEEGLLKTALTLKDMGYTCLQFSGAPFDAGVIKRVSDASGVPFVLTHAPMDRIIGDTERLMEEHASFGCKNIGLGTIPWHILRDRDEFEKTLDSLARAAETIANGGFKFFYHNHHVEFFKYDGKSILDILIDRIPKVNITLDTYWVQYGGADVIGTVKKLSGRIGCVHLKDYKIKITDDGKFVPDYAPLGDGSMDFGAIIPAMKAAGTEYFLIEMDNAAEADDPFEQVGRCAKYLKNFEV